MMDERLFDVHMFPERSFDVKYQPRRPGPGLSVTPFDHTHLMAAVIALHPDRPVRDPSSSVPVHASRRPTAEVYRRRRLAVAALIIGLLLGALSMGRQADASRTAEAEAADSVVYVVQPGDTLWAIARDLSPGDDPRPLVAALDDIAGGNVLQPGQRLAIPGHLVG